MTAGDQTGGRPISGGVTALPAIFAWRREDVSIELTPVFLFGLGVRIALCLLFAPGVQEAFFIPFMRETLLNPTLDPWTTFIEGGGASNAFPYGVSMYLAHAPTVAIGLAADLFVGGTMFARLGFAASLLVADLATYILLRRLFPKQRLTVGWLYWLSPIVLYTTYYHGQTDIVPIAFLTGALLALRHHWAKAAGILFACAVSAKLSMLLAAPFLFLFAINNRQFRAKGPLFLATALIAGALLQAPFLLSSGAREMIYSSPEIGRIYQFVLPVGEDHVVYLFFVGYVAAVYAAFAVGRINFDLLFAFLGVGFLTVLTLAPAAPGWFVWAAPFLVGYQLTDDASDRSRLLVLAYSVLVIAEQVMIAPGARSSVLGFDQTAPLAARFSDVDSTVSMITTLRTLAGVVIAASMYRRGVASNDFFRLSRRPIAIGIAGDSGTGKDTLSRALEQLFSRNSVIAVSGDDYHRYERGAPMWQVVTHLDPRANDLKAMTLDVQTLLEERAISQSHYDHGTGRFTPLKQTRGNDVVIVSGLHALYTASLRELYDAAIFLDMDDDLRRLLKIERDVGERGYDRAAVERALDRRADDREKFIQPQAANADLIFSLRPADYGRFAESGGEASRRFKLNVRWRDATDFVDLARSLVGLCGARVDERSPASDACIEFEVEGDIEGDDIRLIADKLAPEAEDILGPEPRWENGLLGVMQLIVIIHLIRRTRRRRMRE